MTGYESKRAAARDKLAQPAQKPVAHCEAGPEYCVQCNIEKRKALAQPAQEPFGYFRYDARFDAWVQNCENNQGTPFYTTPAQRLWVGLTDEDCDEVERWVEFKEEGSDRIQTSKLIRYIEAKLKEKNNG